ncbi:MAG TPA: pyruvate:ferredoxin (flavodoxin) oxidoreductase, partial [Ilumatobacteraceae bacterium]|nr:pyruvate:ferredoxin (flavodoxin) oxidoreductase [Ilumatobacteraceae bacterium]
LHYEAVPGIVSDVLDELAARTGRRYGLVDYIGAPDAERVVMLMGSAAGAAAEAVETLTARGEKVGVLIVRLYRPFPAGALLDALPATVRSIAVLDRTKEPGSVGEPLYLDVVAALAESNACGTLPFAAGMPRVIGGRYGLSSKEFLPSHVGGVFRELAAERPRPHVTVGIFDDVTHLSVDPDREVRYDRPAGEVQAMFFGLGSDGTVGANKASVKIIGEETDLFAQGYFVYDSKKSGSVTISHLRFGPQPIRSSYLIDDADFVACHQFGLLEKMKVVEYAKAGATMLLNSPWPATTVWDHLPAEVQHELIAKDITLYVIDADEVARATGMANRINTVMQPCFFALSGVLPADEAIAHIKASVEATYGKRGRSIVERNFAAIDASLAALERVEIPSAVTSTTTRLNPIPADAPEFVRRVTAVLLAGEGDLLPVSALPIDGVFPTGTAKYEKRSIASEIPIFDPDVCIDCGRCAAVCPHAAIRMKVYDPDALAGAPAGFRSKSFRSKDVQGQWMSIQVAPDDCTGCGVCVDVCPAKSKSEVRHKAINMSPADEHRDVERVSWDFFLTIPEIDRDALPHDAVKGSQALQPLFEFSGACAGCGETPYIKLVTQLFGDRMIVANATGCSSIFGANLPTTPYAMDDEGRGPVWSNSLFEDNAEFGLGMRLGYEAQRSQARLLLERLAPRLDASLVNELLTADQSTAAAIRAQRQRVAMLVETLDTFGDDLEAAHLRSVAEALVDKGVWIIGGDGWAYDIGFGGLDQVLSSGRNVNILVLDTEVYSNTGGQASKATPRGAVAKFAAAGKSSGKKDLGAIARSYGNVYVAQIAIGSNDLQATKAMVEAEAWPGPSLVIAYSTCIAHGIEMSTSMSHQKDAVRSAYWPLYRFSPSAAEDGTPFQLDSKAPTMPVSEFIGSEARFAILARTNPERAAELGALLQGDADERWRYYSQLATVRRSLPHTVEAVPDDPSDAAQPVLIAAAAAETSDAT